MENFKTSYDAGNMTVSVNSEEVSRALGTLSDKMPATLKVAINRTAREGRKLLLDEVEKRYDLNEAGRRMIKDLRQRQRATNRRLAATLGITKNDPGRFGLFQNKPAYPLHGAERPKCAAPLSGARPER